MKAIIAKIITHPDIYDILFRIGMWWRIVYGAVRVVFGLALLRLVGRPVAEVFYLLMHHETDESSSGIVGTFGSFLHHHSYTVTYFLAAYFMFWGIVDIVLSANLLREKMWAFSVSIYLIGAFVLYELYRVAHTHSLILAAVILTDIALMWLINKEHNRQRVRLAVESKS